MKCRSWNRFTGKRLQFPKAGQVFLIHAMIRVRPINLLGDSFSNFQVMQVRAQQANPVPTKFS